MVGFFYRFFVGVFKLLPFKKQICILLRKLGLNSPRLVADLKFTGDFDVIDDEIKFKIRSFGGGIAHDTFWNGLFVSFENDTGWLWKELSQHSNVVFDIGANIGIYSLVTKAINPNSKVYAFEPSKNTFYKLTENNAVNNYDISCNQIALSDKDGELTFYDVPDQHQKSASLSPDKLKNRSQYKGEIVEYNVKVSTLDSFVENHGVKTIDLMKIDVELHEPEVISGFKINLERFKPVMFIEVLTNEIADKLNEIINLDDYYLYHLAGERKITRSEKFEAHDNLLNFVIFHKDKKALLDTYTDVFK